MITILYASCLVFSILLVIYMGLKNYDNVDIYSWTITVMVPIILLGYTLKTVVQTPEAAKFAFCFIYLDSTVLLVVTIFSMLRFMGVNVHPILKIIGYSAAFCHMAVVWLCVENKLYYDSMVLIDTGYGIATKMTSGPLKIIHFVFLTLAVLTIICLLIYGYVRKGTYSHKVLNTYCAIILSGVFVYAIELTIDVNFSILPFLYTISAGIVVFNYDHVYTHNISCLVSQQQKYYGTKGYIAFDLKKNFLSCNDKIFNFFPELITHRVDTPLPDDLPKLQELFYGLMRDFERHGINFSIFNSEDRIVKCEISKFTLTNGAKPRGYLFDVYDVTKEQHAIKVMESYNDTLNAEVKQKADNIKSIQQKVVLGLANMVENRDNNTGGHVKRTSDIIKYLVEEAIRQGVYDISEEKATDIIRSAPMHDLGKISIDNSILCKPGRLTDEEYAIMKTHSPRSGEIVKLILQDVEEEHFVRIAYNVARYHHERWDGRGYPEGLVGEMVPLEARIMAVADVYDALVSKRCYKEPMSFDKAKEIMLEGMGTQFDPTMLPVFLGCCSRLEEYYSYNN